MLKPPFKTSGLHHKHLSLHAMMFDDMGWQRPKRYTSAEKEAHTARTTVALSDVSPQGKFDIKGQALDAFLLKLFNDTVKTTGKAFVTSATKQAPSNLQDATCYRLTADHAIITCPATQVESSTQVLELHRNGCLHIVDLTSGLAVLRLIGPRSWDVLSKLTEIDLEPIVFQNLECSEGELAKVHALIARKDYAGHLSYEIFCGRDLSEHVWDAIMEAGQEFNINPLGVEGENLLA